MSKVARAFGLEAFRVETAEELERALDEAFNATVPVFLDVVTESEVRELPPVHSWLTASGRDPLEE
jgi:acetolactate synthase-1/2/3 large subunit